MGFLLSCVWNMLLETSAIVPFYIIDITQSIWSFCTTWHSVLRLFQTTLCHGLKCKKEQARDIFKVNIRRHMKIFDLQTIENTTINSFLTCLSHHETMLTWQFDMVNVLSEFNLMWWQTEFYSPWQVSGILATIWQCVLILHMHHAKLWQVYGLKK